MSDGWMFAWVVAAYCFLFVLAHIADSLRMWAKASRHHNSTPGESDV